MPLHRLVTIDLRSADLVAFERYESTVLDILSRHGGTLHFRVRSQDQTTETHLISFQDAAAHAAYVDDPERVAARPLWEGSGATSFSTVVEPV